MSHRIIDDRMEKYGSLFVLKIKLKFWRNYENENFAATLCRSRAKGGGRPVQPWHTLRTNVDCALFVFLFYCFPFFVPNLFGKRKVQCFINRDLQN